MEIVLVFGEKSGRKIVKVHLLVVKFNLIYNCIIGRPTTTELCIVPSTTYLKMKYHISNTIMDTV